MYVVSTASEPAKIMYSLDHLRIYFLCIDNVQVSNMGPGTQEKNIVVEETNNVRINMSLTKVN